MCIHHPSALVTYNNTFPTRYEALLEGKVYLVAANEAIHREGNVLLTTHSTHFIYGYLSMAYGKGPLSEKGNPLLSLHGLVVLINSKGSFICTISQTAEYSRRGALVGMRNGSVDPP